MPAEVDLSQLALRRDEPRPVRVRAGSHVLTRYVLPALLLLGFAALAGWAARDMLFPPRDVSVVPVHATRSQVRREGTPLFKAAGWIEPRPTPVRVAALAPGVVEKLLVVQDQAIEAGEPVAQLIEEDARLAHERALAELALRQAEREEAQAALTAATTRFAQPVHLEAPLREAEAALAQVETELKNLPFALRRAEAQWNYAQRNYEGKTAAEGAVSGRVIDEARSEMESAAALVDELRRRSESLEREQAALMARRDALQTARQLKTEELRAKDEAAARSAQARDAGRCDFPRAERPGATIHAKRRTAVAHPAVARATRRRQAVCVGRRSIGRRRTESRCRARRRFVGRAGRSDQGANRFQPLDRHGPGRPH
jgi:multidrug efflux pump subunit AcrA (membrane-fusion protein)